jgi:hypothetical protein
MSVINYLVQATGITLPVNLVAAIAATTKSGVVPPHSESGAATAATGYYEKRRRAATGANWLRIYRAVYLR